MSMLRRAVVVPLVAALSVAGLAAVGSPAEAADPAPTYYVSLGDSLATGYQPDTGTDEPAVAYTSRLYEVLAAREPGLVHIRLGCSGETTKSFVDGLPDLRSTPCDYSGYDATSQLEAATSFLAAHRGKVTYVSLGIGANDIHPCVPSSGAIDAGALECLTTGITRVGTNVALIDAALREAGGSTPRYVGMTYYNPFLAAYVNGNKPLATISVSVASQLNAAISGANAAHGFVTADVAGAFSSAEGRTITLPPPFGDVPLNVARVCQWTWMCTPYTDIHANDTGHQVIARAFVAALAPSTAPPRPPVVRPPAKVTTRTQARVIGKHRISRTKRARIRVRVVAADGRRLGGRLVVRDGKRRLKVVRIGASGRRVVRLPRLKRAGKHRITVTYKGSSTTRASRSKPVRITVRR